MKGHEAILIGCPAPLIKVRTGSRTSNCARYAYTFSISAMSKNAETIVIEDEWHLNSSLFRQEIYRAGKRLRLELVS